MCAVSRLVSYITDADASQAGADIKEMKDKECKYLDLYDERNANNT